MEKEFSQTSTLHGGTDGNLRKMGVAGSDLRRKDETTYAIVGIAGNKGRRRDRITAPPPMKDVVQ